MQHLVTAELIQPAGLNAFFSLLDNSGSHPFHEDVMETNSKTGTQHKQGGRHAFPRE